MEAFYGEAVLGARPNLVARHREADVYANGRGTGGVRCDTEGDTAPVEIR
jgi:hypothetical protein